MDVIDEMIIRLRVDNVPFEAAIKPTGEYIIFGPIWRRENDAPILADGKINYGFAMPGLCAAIAELIRLKLKT